MHVRKSRTRCSCSNIERCCGHEHVALRVTAAAQHSMPPAQHTAKQAKPSSTPQYDSTPVRDRPTCKPSAIRMPPTSVWSVRAMAMCAACSAETSSAKYRLWIALLMHCTAPSRVLTAARLVSCGPMCRAYLIDTIRFGLIESVGYPLGDLPASLCGTRARCQTHLGQGRRNRRARSAASSTRSLRNAQRRRLCAEQRPEAPTRKVLPSLARVNEPPQ